MHISPQIVVFPTFHFRCCFSMFGHVLWQYRGLIFGRICAVRLYIRDEMSSKLLCLVYHRTLNFNLCLIKLNKLHIMKQLQYGRQPYPYSVHTQAHPLQWMQTLKGHLLFLLFTLLWTCPFTFHWFNH